MLEPRVVLIGFRGTGKTTVGKLLAEDLGVPFVDLDVYLEKRLGQSISAVVSEKGWAYFRAQERQALREMLRPGPLVLACGGGAVLHEEEMQALACGALVAWLTAPKEIIARRLLADEKTAQQRPSLTGQDLCVEIEEVLAEREPLYRRFAHLTLDTSKLLPEEAVACLKQALHDKVWA